MSALVPEISNFEKWIKYANEMTDDVILSTQYCKSYLGHCSADRWNLLQWATKVLRHLAVKFDFLRFGNIFPPFPQNNVDFSISSTAQTTAPTYTTLNWGAGGIRDLTLDANKPERMLKYGKSSFPKSVSTTFVAHCRFIVLQETHLWLNLVPRGLSLARGRGGKRPKPEKRPWERGYKNSVPMATHSFPVPTDLISIC